MKISNLNTIIKKYTQAVNLLPSRERIRLNNKRMLLREFRDHRGRLLGKSIMTKTCKSSNLQMVNHNTHIHLCRVQVTRVLISNLISFIYH